MSGAWINTSCVQFLSLAISHFAEGLVVLDFQDWRPHLSTVLSTSLCPWSNCQLGTAVSQTPAATQRATISFKSIMISNYKWLVPLPILNLCPPFTHVRQIIAKCFCMMVGNPPCYHASGQVQCLKSWTTITASSSERLCLLCPIIDSTGTSKECCEYMTVEQTEIIQTIQCDTVDFMLSLAKTRQECHKFQLISRTSDAHKLPTAVHSWRQLWHHSGSPLFERLRNSPSCWTQCRPNRRRKPRRRSFGSWYRCTSAGQTVGSPEPEVV